MASGSKGSGPNGVTPRPAVFGKPQGFVSCDGVAAVAAEMAAKLANPPSSEKAKWADKYNDMARNVVADWTYWELQRRSGIDAPHPPGFPWALDEGGQWAWTERPPHGEGRVTASAWTTRIPSIRATGRRSPALPRYEPRRTSRGPWPAGTCDGEVSPFGGREKCNRARAWSPQLEPKRRSADSHAGMGGCPRASAGNLHRGESFHSVTTPSRPYAGRRIASPRVGP